LREGTVALRCQLVEKRHSASARRLLSRNSREASQLLPRRIDSLTHDTTIDKYQGQTFRADFGEHLLYNRVLRKCVGLLDEVEPFNSNPLGLEPIEVRCESRQRGIHFGTANAGRTAHRGIENAEDYH
jgi:hypothetical protein